MPRFFVSPENINGNTVTIKGEDVIHIKRVLRLSIDDRITVCDGNEQDYFVSITGIENDAVTGKILDISKNSNEPPVKITLYQGLPKADKFEYIVQKCIELGVDEVVPTITERTVVRLDSNKDIEKKLTRWRKIALEAAKQCNRGKIPNISEPVYLNDAIIESVKRNSGVIAYENAENRPQSVENISNAVSVFIGPEGGFTPEEVSLAQSSGIKPVSLGPRILRTETAGVVLVTIIMNKFGDIRPFG
ncbi:MAG TPA: 16S rRNA (uracil(1498)-N(3))-methyltransferase [Clostridiaceae bacterium]|nr:16S rRNA (uracil(1498)-N(3))-methyltransferase [Clostridiaceae bacterium]